MGKKKKKTLLQRIYKKRRLYILILIIILVIALCIWMSTKNDTSTDLGLQDASNYSEETTNQVVVETVSTEPEVNLIDGQTLIENGDGYTTTFTISNTEYPKTYIEYKQNLGSWAESSYWGGTMTENGCGITSISIIASGYGSEYTPEYFRSKYYPHLEAEDIVYAINLLGIECTEFYFDSSVINTKYISNWLETGRPILVCLDSSEENIWTEASHYMVLLDINENGEIYVSNPNGLDGTEKASGWYEPSEVIPYIVKVLFIESYQ